MSDDLCHSCPRRGDCLIADSATAPERCTYHQRAADALPRAELRPALLAALRADPDIREAVRAAVAAGRCG